MFDSDPLSSAPHLMKDTASYQRTVFYRKSTDRSTGHSDIAILLSCSMKPVEPAQIEIAEIKLQTILLEENCRSGKGDEQTNFFWVDPYDGFTWQSRQKIVEGYPAVEIGVLKPEG